MCKFRRELVSWHLTAVELRDILKAKLPKTSTSTASAADSFSDNQQQPQQPTQTNQLQHPTSNSIRIEILNEEEPETKFVEDARSEQTPRRSLVSIQDRLKQARQDDAERPWTGLSIYRIPHYLKDGEDKAYNPQIVSLGPYHHGKKQLRPMERHKGRSLHQVLKRTGHDINRYLDWIKRDEDRARACYEGQIPLGSKEFIEMMVLDGCFILELFQGAVLGFKELEYQSNDPVFSMRGSMHSIQRDMIMLENQIPMFILDRLLGIQRGDPDEKGLVAKLALWFFGPLMPTDPWVEGEATFHPLSNFHSALHCLDVIKRSILISRPEPDLRNLTKQRSNTYRVADKRRQQLICRATELRDVAIKVRKQETNQFWNIEFQNGVLYVPRLLIHDGTRSFFLNLMAFEQSHLDCSNEVTSYVVFMENLINSPEDVAHLHSHGIIEHWLRSDAEVVDMFNQLCQEVVFNFDDSYLWNVSMDVKEEVVRYNKHRCNAWWTSLEHNYFSSPWSIISVIAAVVLLLLTFAQAFYAVYGYYRPARS